MRNDCHYVLCHHVFCCWFHTWNLFYETSPQKQVTDVSLVLKDSEIEFVDPAFVYQMARKPTVQISK